MLELEDKARRRIIDELVVDLGETSTVADLVGPLHRALEAAYLELPVKGGPSWWWVELWREQRTLFKHFVRDVMYFLGTLGVLEGAHRLLVSSTLEPNEKWWLSKVHFWTYIVALGIFGFRFIMTLLRLQSSERKT